MVKYTFSGHESFPCKSLWLKKGYDFVVNGGDFNDLQAVVRLGVGKNMVSSIRYWLKVFGICDGEGKPTAIGDYIFSDNNGKDRFIEDLATLWLMHFNAVTYAEASLYNLLFCGVQRERSRFDRDQVSNFVKLKMVEDGKQELYNSSTVMKDINVLLQTYVLPEKVQSNEAFSSLLIDLDLIRRVYCSNSDDKWYCFNVEGKQQIPKEVFLYGILKTKGDDNTVSYETIREKVGLVFCMNDQEIIDTLKVLSEKYRRFLSYSDIAGIRQVQFTDKLDVMKVLDGYYGLL